MLEHAEREFELLARDEKGHSLRETLQGLLQRARTDERRAELEEQLFVPPVPPALVYLWSAFLRLAARRQSMGFGPARLGWAEIEAFNRMSGLCLRPWEIEVIEALDDQWISATREGDAMKSRDRQTLRF